MVELIVIVSIER